MAEGNTAGAGADEDEGCSWLHHDGFGLNQSNCESIATHNNQLEGLTLAFSRRRPLNDGGY